MGVLVFKDKEPAYVKGGRSRVFLVNKERTRSNHLAADVVTYAPGASNVEHSHKSESFIYIIEGECEMFINGESYHAPKDTMVFLGPGELHWMRNDGKVEMKMIEAFAPNADFSSYDATGKPLEGKYTQSSPVS